MVMHETNKLDIMEAEKKAWEAAEQLEKEFGDGEEDPERLEYFASQCMLLLVKRYTLTTSVPVSTTKELNT
jgi:hypothetical protein